MGGGIWEVTGGKDSGGVTVRTGKELKSPESPGGRLSHGALVAELALEGERLHFTRLTGTGPDDGWISLSFKGKPLVVRAGEAGTKAAKEAKEREEAVANGGGRLKPEPGCYTLWLMPMGSRGDVQPILALAVHAQKVGWAVRIFTSNENKDFVESYGIRYTEAGPSLRDVKDMHKMKEEELSEEEREKRRKEMEEHKNLYKEDQKNFGDNMVNQIYNKDAHMEITKIMLRELEEAEKQGALPDVLFFHFLSGNAAYLLWAKYGMSIFFLDYVMASLSSDEENIQHGKYLVEEVGPDMKEHFGMDPFEGYAPQDIGVWRKESTLSCSSKLMTHYFDEAKDLPEEELEGFKRRFMGPLIMDTASQMVDLGYFGGQETLQTLQDFIDASVAAGRRPAYVGWGSMPLTPEVAIKVFVNMKFTKIPVVFVCGWSSVSKESVLKVVQEIMPQDPFGLVEYVNNEVLFAEVAPHEWLFQRCCMTMHHGGAGTTQAALRAGVPTIITPFSLDQFVWADWVVKLGCGQKLSLIENMERLMDPHWSKAIRKATSDEAMIARAKEVGEQLRQEEGTVNTLARFKESIEQKARGECKGKFGR